LFFWPVPAAAVEIPVPPDLDHRGRPFLFSRDTSGVSRELEVTRRVCEEWGRGDFSSSDWAAPDIDMISADGFGQSGHGVAEMAASWRDFLSSWDEFRVEPEDYLERGSSVLALTRFGGRGKASGLPAEMMRGGARFDFSGGKVVRLTLYRGRARTLEDWNADALDGTWALVEWTASNGEKSRHPLGPDASGRIVYSADGFMSAFLARSDGWSDALAYSGTWERLAGEEVVHHVTLSTVEAFVGTDLVRTVSWERGDLVLTTPPRDGWVNVLRWRREAG
jgi:hypothetical protein